MRVGVITTSFPLTADSSSGVFVQRLLTHLSPHAEITLLTPAATKPFDADLQRKHGFAVRCFRYAPWRRQILAHRPGGIPVALKEQPWAYALLPLFVVAMMVAIFRLAWKTDLLHANWASPGVIAGIVGLLTGRPVITTLRGSDMARLEKSRLNRLMFRLLLWSNGKVICVSEAIRNALLEHFSGYSHKIVVIPNGIDASFLNTRAGSVRSDNSLRLIAVGSLIPRKQMDVIVRAMAHHDVPAGVTLTIVGEGPEELRLRNLVEQLGLHERVHFRGSVVPERMAEELEAHDVLVLASRFEGRPNVVLEAMAAGRAVVASNIDGVNELIEHNKTGLLFDNGDVDALAASLLMLWRQPDLVSELGRQARAFILERKLVWEETAAAYLREYRACLSARP